MNIYNVEESVDVWNRNDVERASDGEFNVEKVADVERATDGI